MIDLTPLDVRNKRGDFKKIMRGYDPQEVDIFLELVAERLEQLVRENLHLRDRTQTLQTQVEAQVGREQAVQDALVTAQELRAEIQSQSQREASHLVKEAEIEVRRMLADADQEVRDRLRGIERRLDQGQDALVDLERRRARFLQEFRGLLEREMGVVQVEESRSPLENRAIDLDLGMARARESRAPDVPAPTPPRTSKPDADAVPASGEGPSEVRDEPAGGVEPAGPEDPSTRSPEAAVTRSAEAAVTRSPEPGAAEGGGGRPDAAVAVDAEPMTTPRSAAEPQLRVALDAKPESSAVDVGDLQPDRANARRSAPPAAVNPEPSSLELELMAGASGARAAGAKADGRSPFEGIPDLETVLAEAGVEEVKPPPAEKIAPPAAPPARPDNVILFDPDHDKHRKH